MLESISLVVNDVVYLDVSLRIAIDLCVAASIQTEICYGQTTDFVPLVLSGPSLTSFVPGQSTPVQCLFNASTAVRLFSSKDGAVDG